MNAYCTDIPGEFICPLTQQVMRVPYQMPDTFTYEKEAIEKALTNKKISPMTRVPMKFEDGQINFQLLNEIDKSRQKLRPKTTSIKVCDTELIEMLLSTKTLLGKGATSTVYRVNNCFTKKGFLCLKILSDDLFKSLTVKPPKQPKRETIWDEEEDQDQEQEEEVKFDFEIVHKLFKEYEILNNLNHPNIINVFGFYNGDRNHNPAILLEYCKFNLEKVINDVDDIYLISFIYEICSAMRFVHDHNIIHRDLKMKNILVNIKKHIKICDFGISKIMDLTTLTSMTHGIGTLAFMAPEIFNTENKYDEKVDVYSFGVVMYYILTKGLYPEFKGTGQYKSLLLPQSINELSQSIIKRCWSILPEERPSFNEILYMIVNNNFMLIDGIENQLPKLKEHLGLD